MAIKAFHRHLLVRVVECAHFSRIPEWRTLVVALERQARYFFNVREALGGFLDDVEAGVIGLVECFNRLTVLHLAVELMVLFFQTDRLRNFVRVDVVIGGALVAD